MAKKIVILDKEGKDTGEAYGPDEGYAAWAARQGAIGLGETPGTFATLYGLFGAGKDYLLAGKDEPQEFKEHLYTTEGRTKLKEYNQEVYNHLKESYPDYDDEQINKRFEHIQKHSKKYFKETSEFMRPGISFGRRWGLGTNEFFGDPRLPTERTQADTVMNIVGGAAPVPGVGALTSATGATGAKVAAKIATNTPLRYGVNVAEAVTPATLYPAGATTGQIAGRVGLNVGVGTAADQGVRIYNSDPSVVTSPIESAKGFFTKDDGTADITAIGATGAVATVLGARIIRNVTRIKSAAPSGGPPRATMEEAARPEPNLGLAQAGSDIEPLYKYAKAAGIGDEDLTILRTKIDREAGPNPVADHNNWVAERLSPISERFIREDPQFQTLLQQHIADRARIYGDDAAITKVADELTEAQKTLALAVKSRAGGNKPGAAAARAAKLTQANDRVNDLTQELQIRKADSDPNLRSAAVDESRADVRARLTQSSQDPRVRAVERQLFERYDDIVDVAANDGIISPAKALSIKSAVRQGNFSLSERALTKKGWLETAKDKATKWTEDHLIYPHTDGALALYRGIQNNNFRKGYLTDVGGKQAVKYVNRQPNWKVQPRTNNPADPFSELAFMSVRTRQSTAANRMMKDFAEAIEQAPGNADGRYLRHVDRIPEAQVPSKINEIIAKMEKKDGPYTLAYFDRGDLVIKEHNSAIIRDLFKFSPASVVPVLHQSRRLTQTWLTGAGNPTWALTGMPWDMAMGALFRNPNMVFGPVSGLAHEALGRGSFLARYISAAATPADLAATMARLPLVAGEAMMHEIMGNQLSKRWQAQLATNSGVISMIAKLPGGRAILEGATNAMAKAYDESMTHMTKAYKVGHVSNYSDELLTQMKRVDELGRAYPMYKSAWNSYKSVLSVLHDVPKQMFLSQNLNLYKRELAKGKALGKTIDEAFIANEARMIGGDLARQSGNPWVQRATSAIPYGNVALQSLRYTGSRLRSNGVEGMVRLGAMGTAAAWAYQYVASGNESADWYFNQLPQEQRMNSLPIPNALRHARRMFGENIPPDPAQDFFLVRMPPEMLPFIVPVMHGLMALGLIDSRKAEVPPAITKDMRGMVDQLFGLGLPPLANSALAYAGYKIEPSKAIMGENPVRQIRDFTFSGANKDKMSPESRIPHAWHDAFNAMFGTTTGTILEAINYADVLHGGGKSFGEAVEGGVKKLAVERAARTPYANHIWPDVNRRFIYTPYTQKAQEDLSILRQGVEQMKAEPGLRMENTLINTGRLNVMRENTVDMLRGHEGTSVGGQVQDPDVASLLADTHLNLFSGPFVQLQKDRRQARRLHESLTIGANPNTKDSPLARFKKAQEQAKEVNRLDREIYTRYQDIWKDIVNSPSGKAFQQKFGPLTPENLVKQIQASATAGSRGPR